MSRWRMYWSHSRLSVFKSVLLRRLPVRVLRSDVPADEATKWRDRRR